MKMMNSVTRVFQMTNYMLFSTTIVWMVKALLLLVYACLVSKVTGACVANCVGTTNGDYQHCTTCTKYITCSNDILYEMPCPPTTFYDDIAKSCLGASTTCTEPTTSITTTSTAPTTTSADTTIPTTEDTTEIIIQDTTQEPVVSSTDTLLKYNVTGESFASLWYKKTLIPAVDCPSTNSSGTSFASRKVRSRIECGQLCNLDIRCWYFQIKNSLCSMYETTPPPCSVDIYKYNG